MSSINTNLGAMVALDTLKGINKNLNMVQNEISTGKSINSAKDNAAIWSISTVMETDVAGFEQIGNSLNLGSASVGVARTASEAVVGNLQDIRESIISAQESSVDRVKIQFDIDEAVKQIQSTVSGAQFNGSNLLSEAGELTVLSSLDRSSDGTVTAANITINKANLSTADNRVALTSADEGFATAATTGLDNRVADAIEDEVGITLPTIANGDDHTFDFEIAGVAISVTDADYASGADQDAIATAIISKINTELTAAGVEGITAKAGSGASEVAFDVDGGVDATISGYAATTDGTVALTGTTVATTALDNSALPADATDVLAFTISDAAAGEATGSLYEVVVGGETATYTATATDTEEGIAAGIVAAINALSLTGITAKVDSSDASQIDFDVTGGVDASVTVTQQKVQDGKTVGNLAGLADLNVTTDAGAASALTDIEAFLNTAIDAAAEFGSKQKRIDNQINFVGSLTDSLKAGISTLTDANLEEASARLQALQVQQQLGVQALSIANQAPQALLGLFR